MVVSISVSSNLQLAIAVRIYLTGLETYDITYHRVIMSGEVNVQEVNLSTLTVNKFNLKTRHGQSLCIT